MKLNKLEQYLQDVDAFESPVIRLEQYMTPPNITACMVHTIQSSFGDIEDKLVADLGCGTGMLTIASSLLGAAFCTGFDIDIEALKICANNLQVFEIPQYDLILCDITSHDTDKFHKLFDTVIMNPPFGTNIKGMDVEFLKVALSMAKGAVYSLHKTSTREHITLKARSWKVKSKVIAQLRFDLPHTYSFHKKKSVDIAVDLHRFWDL